MPRWKQRARRALCQLCDNSSTGRVAARMRPHPRAGTNAASANSTNRHSAFASRICSIVRQLTSSSRGLATRYARHRAREIATFSRLRESRNSRPRGTSSPLELAIEKMTTSASWPWNLSTVPTRAPRGQRLGAARSPARCTARRRASRRAGSPPADEQPLDAAPRDRARPPPRRLLPVALVLDRRRTAAPCPSGVVRSARRADPAASRPS